MNATFLTMVATAALAVATPAAAQPPNGPPADTAELRTQINTGARNGALVRNDLPQLREGLAQLIRLERRFSAEGFTARELLTLQEHRSALHRQITRAERARENNRYDFRNRGDWEARYDQTHRAAWEARYVRERVTEWEGRFGSDGPYSLNARFDRPNRGDRFHGDVRVGQRHSARTVAVPAEYRLEYQDNAQFYYGYDTDRIYRIDRVSNLILAMIDLPS